MTEIASKTPDRNNHKETIKMVSCFDDAKNRIHKEAKGFYEANKNNPKKIQDLRSFLGFQEEDRISLDKKYNTKRLEIKNETNTGKAKLYLYKKLSINEQLQSNDWGNKYRKGFIDGLASGGELVENLMDLKPDDIVENLEDLDIKEHIKKGYDRLVSLKKDDVIAKIKQAWNETDGIYTIGMIVSGIGIIGKGKEIISGAKSLYEIPEYKFLEKHKDILGENPQLSDILGEGNNAIIINHPKYTKLVIKIPKEGKVDDVILEFENHKLFAETLKEGKREGKVDKSIKIPKIYQGDDLFYMQKIDGQNLHTLTLKEHFADILKNEKKEDLDKMSDYQFKQLLINKYGEKEWYINQVIADYSGDKLGDLMGMSYNYYKANGKKGGTPLQIAEQYLYDKKGLIHKDLHPGNIMLGNDGKSIYMIDFGRVSQYPLKNK